MGVLGALLSAGSSLIGSIQGGKNIDKQIQAQQEENQKNREYNLMLANLQNQWNVEQWERENDYNDPSAQMSRLARAGLNPNLVYGNGATSLSAQSPTMTAGAPSSPVDMSALGQKPTIGQAAAAAIQNAATIAQAQKTISEAEKTEQETQGQKYTNEILKSDAAFRNAINGGTLKLQDMDILLRQSNIDLTDAQVSKTKQEVVNLQASLDNLRGELKRMSAQVSLMTQEELESAMRTETMRKTLQPTINKLVADAGLSYASAKRLVELLPFEVAGMDLTNQGLQIDLSGKETQNAILKISEKMSDLQTDTYEDLGFIGRVVQILVQGLSGVTPLLKK